MLKNYFKIAWRSLWRNKITTLISVLGLTTGVACFFLLSTYILNELRFDRFHDKAGRIVFVNFNYQSPSDKEATHTPVTPTAVAPVVKRQFSEVEESARVYQYGERTFKYADKVFVEKKMSIADDGFFRIFSFHFIEGNPVTALKNPNALVMTQSTARKYFGDEPALGKTVQINDKAWQVTGVTKDVPPYSSLQFDVIGSYVSDNRSKTEVWNSANDRTFLLLKSASQLASVQQKLNSYLEKQFPEDFKSGSKFWFQFEPLTRIHLHPQTEAGSKLVYLYILGTIAVLLLVIACINFTNLITAKSTERSREIGVRKVLGAGKPSLIIQFMAESGIITLFALVLGALIAFLSFPAFNRLTGLELGLNIWKASYFVLVLSVLFILVTVLSGAWPAFVLSAFKPVSALKNQSVEKTGSGSLRKVLVVFQFTVSIAFIIATFIAQKQLYFIQHTNTGINRSQTVVLDLAGIPYKKMTAMKQQLLSQSDVAGVTVISDSPVDIQGGYTIGVAGQTGRDGMSITAMPVDKDFVTALDMKIVAGRNFTYADEQQVLSDSSDKRQYAFMLNEKAVKAMGLTPENAIGKVAQLNGRTGVLKAVLKDFNFSSLHEEIKPVVIFAEYDYLKNMLIKTRGGEMTAALGGIEKIWKQYFPDKPFDYHFLDDEYNDLYKAERRTTAVLNLFSTLTILISCMGLFGLAVFTAAQRTKEIGIRKVLGASVTQIVALLSGGFLKLVLIALLIASPLVWYAMNIWLQDFAYKISMPYGLFILSGACALLIAFFTVSFQAVKAALANPVKSLRSE